MAIGSKAFVEGVFRGCRDAFGAKRKEGSRKIREIEPVAPGSRSGWPTPARNNPAPG